MTGRCLNCGVVKIKKTFAGRGKGWYWQCREKRIEDKQDYYYRNRVQEIEKRKQRGAKR